MNSPKTANGRPQAVYTLESLMANTTEEGDCLLWKGYLRKGSPYVYHSGRMLAVRRLVLLFRGKPMPDGDFADQTCGNPSCIHHCVHRTKSQHSKAIAASGPRNETTRAAKVSAYARKHRAKLTIEKALAIRLSDATGRELSREHGISPGVVHRIKRNEAWRDYSSPFAGLGGR